jgi:hypothetical protein
MQRALPGAVLDRVLASQGVTLTPTQRKRLLALDAESAKAETDVQTRTIIDAMNAEYRVGVHAENEPYSPFETKPGRNGSALSAEDAATKTATAHRETVAGIATASASETVPMDSVLLGMIDAVRALDHRIETKTGGYGDKEACIHASFRLSTLVFGLGAKLRGVNLSPSDHAAYVAALTPTETETEPTPDALQVLRDFIAKNADAETDADTKTPTPTPTPKRTPAKRGTAKRNGTKRNAAKRGPAKTKTTK